MNDVTSLPSGIYNFKPHRYPNGYLTYEENAGAANAVTAQGTHPANRTCYTV